MILFLLSRRKIRETDEDHERGENWSRECLRGRDRRNPASGLRDAWFPSDAFFPNQDPLRSTSHYRQGRAIVIAGKGQVLSRIAKRRIIRDANLSPVCILSIGRLGVQSLPIGSRESVKESLRRSYGDCEMRCGIFYYRLAI